MQILLSTLFINFRFAVMSFALVPHLKRLRTGGLMVGAQLVTMSTFAVCFLRFQRRSDHDNFIYFLGVAIPSYICYLMGTVVGYHFGVRIPAGFDEGISLIFPAYLTALLAAELRERRSIVVVGVAFLATPVVETLVPGWGLILNAIVVATAAIGVEAWWESALPSS
jgi:predicted branched-subunit amino acid permease